MDKFLFVFIPFFAELRLKKHYLVDVTDILF